MFSFMRAVAVIATGAIAIMTQDSVTISRKAETFDSSHKLTSRDVSGELPLFAPVRFDMIDSKEFPIRFSTARARTSEFFDYAIPVEYGKLSRSFRYLFSAWSTEDFRSVRSDLSFARCTSLFLSRSFVFLLFLPSKYLPVLFVPTFPRAFVGTVPMTFPCSTGSVIRSELPTTGSAGFFVGCHMPSCNYTRWGG